MPNIGFTSKQQLFYFIYHFDFDNLNVIYILSFYCRDEDNQRIISELLPHHYWIILQESKLLLFNHFRWDMLFDVITSCVLFIYKCQNYIHISFGGNGLEGGTYIWKLCCICHLRVISPEIDSILQLYRLFYFGATRFCIQQC